MKTRMKRLSCLESGLLLQKDPNSVPSTCNGGTQLPIASASGCPTPLSGFHKHLHSCAQPSSLTHTQNTHTKLNINFKEEEAESGWTAASQKVGKTSQRNNLKDEKITLIVLGCPLASSLLNTRIIDMVHHAIPEADTFYYHLILAIYSIY